MEIADHSVSFSRESAITFAQYGISALIVDANSSKGNLPSSRAYNTNVGHLTRGGR
jgi:hypothetical protein